jgi:hypothetical protein
MLQDGQWKSALSLAPALVEKCRQVWQKVSSRGAAISVPVAPAAEPLPAELRIPEVERRVRQLESEAAASFEVVSAIAQQHSQLAEQQAQLVVVVDALLQRTRALVWSCAVLALCIVALLVLALGRV